MENKKKPMSVDVNLSSEKTLKMYANMWYRFANVPQSQLEKEIADAQGKDEVVAIIKKYFDDIVELTYMETGDYR